MHRHFGAILIAAVLALAGGAALAQPGRTAPAARQTEGPAWQALSAQQRAALAPLQRDWAGLDGARKAKWLEVAARFPSMPQAEQQRVQLRMGEWSRLTPAERGQARLSYQGSRQLSGEQKQQRWDEYQALSPEQREALARRAKPERTPQRGADTAAARALSASAAGTAPAAKFKPVSPTTVQAKPGATTTPMTRAVPPPKHQPPSRPAIAAKPGEFDRRTLLPRSGPQAAPAPAASSARQP